MKKIAVALSGGVDSLVAAALLKDQGYEVIGIHFLTGFGPLDKAEPFNEDTAVRFAARLKSQLAIPVAIVDCRRAFKRHVIDYFTATYCRGRTPNPCLVCNPAIKFGVVKARAHALGADGFATGHYARVQRTADGYTRLLRGVDPFKDQSYFLARLSGETLSDTLFPMGGIRKRQTLRLAAEKELAPVFADESQDICFVGKGPYDRFISRQSGFRSQPGPITDRSGREIGRHEGLHRFTVGQRRGINIPAPVPFYVLALDVANNRLIVGFKQDTYASACTVTDLHWVNAPPDPSATLQTRIRCRHRAAPSRLKLIGADRAVVRFQQPQSAVTPGQGAVYYQGEEVLGCGMIRG